MQEALVRIRGIVTASGDRIERARHLAEVVRGLRNYRWTGVYDVGKEMVSIIAYSGPGAPAYPTFPISKGLTGSAIREKATVVVADVRKDPRYLTAFGNTLAEIIVPVLDPQRGEVIGTIDVESEHADAFFCPRPTISGRMRQGGAAAVDRFLAMLRSQCRAKELHSYADSGSSIKDSWRTTMTIPESVTWKRRLSASRS